ncbi:TonB-dependent receptor domain-containing protein [Lysobacter cavernae]|uniref:TonB-dependent receptor domain-containing protein n=1 Tax=Lysobacter cavernae TaxID=1685901 RepID=A0ABV7RSC0_9GAMM
MQASAVVQAQARTSHTPSQEAAPEEPGQEEGSSNPDFVEARTLDNVVVTGSRVARPDLVNPMPVSVIHMDEALRFGQTSLYDVLTQNPAIGIGNSLSSSVTGWDAGAAFVNLRNLGTNRSLTLIDGKRRVSSSARSSAVDIGTIPLGMIERVDIVTGGAAAVYGADAVTGAVNIITKKDIEETTLSATKSLSERGDSGEFNASISTGFKFADDRGRFTIGGTYTKTDPLYMSDRYDWTQQPFNLANPANTGTSDGIPDNITLYDYRQHYYAYEPNFWLAGDKKRYMLQSDGSVRAMVHDTFYGNGPAQFATGGGGDGRNLTDHYQFRGGEESASVLGLVDFYFTDSYRGAGWFNYAKTDYDGDFYPWRDDTRATFFGGAGGAKAYLDNPFLPDSIRAVMEEKGLTSLSIDRTYGNFPVRDEVHHRRTFTVGGELGGDLTDYIGWSAFVQYGKVEDHAIEGNVPWKSHWLAARDVIEVDGQPVCRDVAARAAGCVPLNIFSTSAPSQSLLDYVLNDRDEYRTTTQKLAGAQINGSAFELPAGDMNFAAGIEYRKDTLKNTDDPLALSGELVYGGGPGARSQLDVASDVSEVFAEVMLPVLADVSFAKRLDLELAYRYSDYSTVGGTDAWKAGLIWEPVQGFAVRGVRSRSVRTPNFGELYEPIFTSTTAGSISDPCMVGSYYATATRAANCKALGVPEPIVDPKIGPHITTGGNPELAPETSDSLTVGFVWQPSFLENFDLTVDYWDIEIADVVTQLSYTTILNLCVDLPSIDNPYCAAVGRNLTPGVPTQQHGVLLPAGAALWVKAQQDNISRLYARGIDVSARYRVDVGPGRLGFQFAGTYLLEHVTETTPGIEAGDVISDGAYSNPHVRASLTTTYDVGKFGVALLSRFLGHGRANVNAISNEQYDDNTVPSRTYHDLSARYSFDNGQTLSFGVSNLFDTKPPYMGFGEPGIYANSQVYDLVGRAYNLTWTYTF